MQVIVTDREGIERGVILKTSYAVISIRDPDRRRPRVRRQSGLRGVLYLAFHDAEPSTGFVAPSDIILMTPEQAKRIWMFTRQQLAAGVGAVIVHCEQGMSRSPAVAAAICEVHGEDAGRFFRTYQPNQYVYQLVRGHQPAR